MIENTANAAHEPTIIDLRKPGDLNLVYRAVLNGWKVPQHVRNQLSEQLDQAMDHYQHAGDPRSTRRLIKMAKMVLLMDVSNRVDAGERKSLHPIGRKRYPEEREPRSLRRRIRRIDLEGILRRLTGTQNSASAANSRSDSGATSV